ncbi:hypothetical protein GTQ34_02310 [Muricauda sp. JGD-17]|uniref:Secreted protein n=1 Tax=Flagellimonas ochracea TaxID=2696472 RepID=A0A964TAS6_9FLAO|nr:hypothetical protein [Allomuricauda ochracea]NAY90741.1 hypothetical protein [Allomuricauda ochracea]
MKKVLTIAAVALFTLGMFSCEAETDVQEAESLFASLDQEATDGKEANDDDRQ